MPGDEGDTQRNEQHTTLVRGPTNKASLQAEDVYRGGPVSESMDI